MVTEVRSEIYASSLFAVFRDAGPIVIIARSAQTLGGGRAMEQALGLMRSEVQRASAGRATGLLYDFRRAVSRTDNEFEQAFARARPLICQGFTRVAFLMSGTLGKLQAQRYARDDGLGAQAFLNEKLALAFVRPNVSSS
jgi:hypothetical protein